MQWLSAKRQPLHLIRPFDMLILVANVRVMSVRRFSACDTPFVVEKAFVKE